MVQDQKDEKRRQSKRQSRNQSSKQSRRQSRRQSRELSRKQSSHLSKKGSHSKSRKSTFVHKHLNFSNAQEVLESLIGSNQVLESPINLCREDMATAEIPPLTWSNYDANPLFLKMTNTTNTVVVNAQYPSVQTPTLAGGPLSSVYKFAQFHFHWGTSETRSEHLIEGNAYPLEAHVVMYNSDYLTFEEAKLQKDGIIILVYLFQIGNDSTILNFTKHLPKIRQPYTQIPLTTVGLDSYFPIFESDYVLYFGFMSGKCNHGILWLINRNTMTVTQTEIDEFKRINTKVGEPIINNCRDVQPLLHRTILIVNPTLSDRDRVLHPPVNVRQLKSSPRDGKRKSRQNKQQSRRQSKRQSRRQSQKNRRQSKKARSKT